MGTWTRRLPDPFPSPGLSQKPSLTFFFLPSPLFSYPVEVGPCSLLSPQDQPIWYDQYCLPYHLLHQLTSCFKESRIFLKRVTWEAIRPGVQLLSTRLLFITEEDERDTGSNKTVQPEDWNQSNFVCAHSYTERTCIRFCWGYTSSNVGQQNLKESCS